MSRSGKKHLTAHPETIYPSESEEKMRASCRNEGEFLWRIYLKRKGKI